MPEPAGWGQPPVSTTRENLKSDGRPDWVPDSYDFTYITKDDLRRELDKYARNFFDMTGEEFMRIYRDSPDGLEGHPVFSELAEIANPTPRGL